MILNGTVINNINEQSQETTLSQGNINTQHNPLLRKLAKNKIYPLGAKVKLIPVKLDQYTDGIHYDTKNDKKYNDYKAIKMNFNLNKLKEIINSTNYLEENQEKIMVFMIEDNEDKNINNRSKPEKFGYLPNVRKKLLSTINSCGSVSTNSECFRENDCPKISQEQSRKSTAIQTSDLSLKQNSTSSKTSKYFGDCLPFITKENSSQILNYCRVCTKCIKNGDHLITPGFSTMICQCSECKILSRKIELKNILRKHFKQKPKYIPECIHKSCTCGIKNRSNANFRQNYLKQGTETLRDFNKQDFSKGDNCEPNSGMNCQIITSKIVDETKFCCEKIPNTEKLIKCPCCLKITNCYKYKQMTKY